MLTSLLNSFMSQSWEDLILLHWPISWEELAPTIPSDLELDLFEGDAWASVVGFRLTNLRISPLRAIPWNDFLEVNLRTYVKDRQGRRGVWFHSLDSSDLLSVLGARLLYGLSYFHSRIKMEKVNGILSFCSCRNRFWGGRRATIEAETSAQDSRSARADSDLDRFLLERYRFWVRRKLGGFSSSAIVEHRPYDACLVENAGYAGSLFKANGMNEPLFGPVVAHYCKGFQVNASGPQWAFQMAGQRNHR